MRLIAKEFKKKVGIRMAHVIVLDSVNEDIFVCGLCKSVFNSLELFLDHKRINCATVNLELISTNNNILTETLPDCNPGEIAQTSVPQAESTESPGVNSELTCTVCKKTFEKKRRLQAHTKTHYVKPFQCLVCGRCFLQNSHVQRHILTHKVWPEGLSETTPKCLEMDLLSFSCPYCTKMFSNYNRFRSHLKNHQSLKKFKCIQGDCKEFYDTFEMLLRHVSSYHITQLYICHICNEPFNSLQSIASHEIGHKGFENHSIQTKQYKCSQCDAVFTKQEKLSLHMLTENHKKVCIHCKKTYASDKRLRMHLQTHRDLKLFKCDICNRSFNMKKYLTAHMTKHGTKEFKCLVCKQMFYRSDILRRHMRSHTATMFPCPYSDTLGCKREYSRKDKLKLHMRSHNYKLIEDSSQVKTNGPDFIDTSNYHHQDAPIAISSSNDITSNNN